ncbi:MAG: ATP-binding protein [Pseudomonadota bacterium]
MPLQDTVAAALPSWATLMAALILMASVLAYVVRLNLRLRHSKRVLEGEIAERRRAEERLADNEQRLRQIIASEPECVKLQTLDGILLEMNPAGLRLVEAGQPEEIVGTSVYRVIAPEFRAAYQALSEKVFQGESGILEFQIISLKGRRRWMETHAVPLTDARGQVVALLGITRDITARKRAEDEVRLHYRELAHAARVNTMGEMASGLAHELNQPLAAIANYSRGCLRRLRAGKDSADELARAFEQVCSQADRAGDIIRSLRRFVRKDEAPPRPVDLADVLREALLIAEPEASQHQVRIATEVATGMAPVPGDAIQIEQVILNLARNAVEAMDEVDAGRRLLRIRVFPDANGVATVEVGDSGPGLPGDMLNPIFEPFFTTKANGMGMGLAICRSIVEAHGGTLGVRPNETGPGLVFRFNLPGMEETFDHE